MTTSESRLLGLVADALEKPRKGGTLTGFEASTGHAIDRIVRDLREAARSAAPTPCDHRGYIRYWDIDGHKCSNCDTLIEATVDADPTRPTRGEEATFNPACVNWPVCGCTMACKGGAQAAFVSPTASPSGADSQPPNIDALNRVARPEEPARADLLPPLNGRCDHGVQLNVECAQCKADFVRPAPPTLQDASHVPPHAHKWERFGNVWLCACGRRITDDEMIGSNTPEASGTAREASSKASDSVSASPSPSQEGRAGELRADETEQNAFEAWATKHGYDMTTHPLHWLFLNRETYQAREGWKAALAWMGTREKPSGEAGALGSMLVDKQDLAWVISYAASAGPLDDAQRATLDRLRIVTVTS